VRRDLSYALRKAREAGVPLVIGSAGMGGGNPHLALVRGLLLEEARAHGLHFKLATIASEIDRHVVLDALRAGAIRPMPDVGELTESAVTDSVRIVGQMGTEPLAHALAPIARGYDPGLALHMAKIMECGAQCALPLAPNDCLLGTIRRDHFLIRPLAPHRVVSPESVAAHTMYEQSNPLMLYEPEGDVDMSDAHFEQVDRQTVRVSGSRFLPARQLTVKLEGARSLGFRAFTVAGIRDRTVIENLPVIEEAVRAAVRRNLGVDVDESGYALDFRVYGRDGVLGALEPERHRVPHEVGLLIEVVARTQELASHVLSLARSSTLHCPFPGRKTTAGNLAFPFSPSDVAAGEVFEFSVYHLMDTPDPLALFPVHMETV
jgi:hypothetical protein